MSRVRSPSPAPKFKKASDGGRLFSLPEPSPDFEVKSSVRANEFEACSICCNDRSTVIPGCERYEHVEMQIPELFWSKSLLQSNLGKKLAGVEPVLLRRHKDWLIQFQSFQKISVCLLTCSPPKLSQDNGRASHQAGQISHPLLMSAASQVVDDHGCIEYEDPTHGVPRTWPFRDI